MDASRLPYRRSIRLRDYDYSRNGAYFVTICTTQRLSLFGAVDNGEFHPSPIGKVVDSAWQDLPNHTPGLVLDAWVVLPNHLHGILVLPGSPSVAPTPHTAPRGARPASLGAIVGGFKSAVSRQVADKHLTLVRPLWQRNYFERIIRNDRELDAIRRYIETNPARWYDAPDHPRHHPDL